MLGLPDSVAACLSDLGGVLTKTARLLAPAWQEMFARQREPGRTGSASGTRRGGKERMW